MTLLLTADAVATGDGIVGNSILVDDGTVLAIGQRDRLEAQATDEIEYRGATLIPGLRDAHMHPIPYAALLSGCSLKQATDMSHLQQMVADYSRTLGADQPVVATRFDDESLAERRLPTRHDLDQAVPDRPVVVYRYCGHVTVANSLALAASDITADTPDPDGGSIDRDVHGQPTGVLRETASGLVTPALARGGDLLDEETVLAALRGLAGVGITSIGAMVGYGERPFEQLHEELGLWCRIADRLPLKVHVYAITDTPERLGNAEHLLDGCGDRLRWIGVKRFADGSLGGHTAAMNSSFTDVDTIGTLRLSEADTVVARKSLELGGMVAIHAIGDRAVDGVLDVFDVLVAEGADPDDLRVEHVSVISPAQIERFSRLGTTAVVQPAFLASESDWIADRVGQARVSWLYPFRSLLEAGVPIAGSSDCPVEPPQPLWGMASAMDRHSIATDERVTGADALAMFTTGAAKALREPAPLSAGSPADIVVLDTNPITATASEIRNARILDTYVDGVVVDVDRSLPVWPD